MSLETGEGGLGEIAQAQLGDARPKLVASARRERCGIPETRRERRARLLDGARFRAATVHLAQAAPGAVRFALGSAGPGAARPVHGRVSPGPS